MRAQGEQGDGLTRKSEGSNARHLADCFGEDAGEFLRRAEEVLVQQSVGHFLHHACPVEVAHGGPYVDVRLARFFVAGDLNQLQAAFFMQFAVELDIPVVEQEFAGAGRGEVLENLEQLGRRRSGRVKGIKRQILPFTRQERGRNEDRKGGGGGGNSGHGGGGENGRSTQVRAGTLPYALL